MTLPETSLSSNHAQIYSSSPLFIQGKINRKTELSLDSCLHNKDYRMDCSCKSDSFGCSVGLGFSPLVCPCSHIRGIIRFVCRSCSDSQFLHLQKGQHPISWRISGWMVRFQEICKAETKRKTPLSTRGSNHSSNCARIAGCNHNCAILDTSLISVR